MDAASRIHRMDPRLKIVCAVTLIVLIGLTPMGSFGAYLGFFALVMALAIMAQLDPWRILKRSFVAVPFALAAITLIFTIPGRELGTAPVVGWVITEEGVIRFASIMFKSLVSVQVGVLLILTTHLTDVLWALGELRVPRILVAVISFMYRYIFLMADEALRLTRARDSRSAVIGGSVAPFQSTLFRARTTGRMIGNLFLRSFERSERVYQAMVSRGYQGVMKQLAAPPLRLPEVIATGLVILIGVALAISPLVFRV
jgi:cobalt/nickel transport system permease protein